MAQDEPVAERIDKRKIPAPKTVLEISIVLVLLILVLLMISLVVQRDKSVAPSNASDPSRNANCGIGFDQNSGAEIWVCVTFVSTVGGTQTVIQIPTEMVTATFTNYTTTVVYCVAQQEMK